MRGHKKTKESGFFEGDSTETEVMTNTLKRTKVYTTSGDGRRIVEISQEDTVIPSQKRGKEGKWLMMILYSYIFLVYTCNAVDLEKHICLINLLYLVI